MDQDDNTTPGPVQVYLRVPEGMEFRSSLWPQNLDHSSKKRSILPFGVLS